ncbi:aminodeoxychorismate lyase [Bacillus sp. FJAT-49732]|uniref:Aminodeoxychorismate lyase n=1 Tax=Lederbergia citrisecunda TaxID=2833583 RepID=A0A942TIS1_9BACI|nr:aminodeoxychorismate lyase [Lederbergia citrisecunda]MBS4198308.1 aminodeoxychorismate lyase [Lederbergia citrisecunda]
MFIYLNGQFIEKEKAMISPFDHGYLYGLGVFETFRTYGGHPFLLMEHLNRLNAGLEELFITRTFEYEEVLSIIDKLSELNGLKDSYIRFNVSAGSGEIGLQTESYDEPTVIMFQKPLQILSGMVEKEAVVLELRRNSPETTYRLKSHHFFNNVAAKREVGPNPSKEGIFLAENGYIAEGVTSNVFWVKNGVLYTPAIETGILNGITREFVMQLAKQAGMLVEEGFYKKEVLEEADEIFFTNSVQEIVPVNQLEIKRYPGKKGKYVQKLNKLYQIKVYALR